VVTDAASLPPLEAFAAGSLESPEHSATLLVEVASLDGGPAVEWRGPGIQRYAKPCASAACPSKFWAHWQANHAAFPQGIDIVFTCADAALGLPRTTRVRRLEGI
jgi:alpha-D-ribose 1-methylphosphonate 5-triphosphate synthase subunit PhnH